ncbi:hypothetical protein ACFSUS_18430 [Spirosoma soli]|uniref:Uncharacterized protein n=1 Tax=Spirosoma soli TaxID=1770529 RepID=A0ABW5M8T0_9BACT
MGLTLMIIIFVVGVVAVILMISRLSGKGGNKANDPEAGSRPGINQQGPSDRS